MAYTHRARKVNPLWNINLVVTFPEVPHCEEIQGLWRELLKINRLLSVRPHEVTEHTATQFKTRSKEFVRTFTDICIAWWCTWVSLWRFMVHYYHLPNTDWKSTMTAWLKTTLDRSSSHHGQECLTQIMQKQNRIELLEHSGAKWAKRFSVTCCNCGKQGHNRLTCSKPCKVCKHSHFSSHLFIVDGTKIPQY